MEQELIQIEKEMDEKLKSLSIWEIPFQSILTCLLFTVEQIDFNGKSDTATDYISRLSLIYPLIKKYAKNKEVETTTQSLLKTLSYTEDIIFLNSYAHFSMIMPQIHRGTFKTVSIKENLINLDYFDDSTKDAELIDKLYSYISLHVIVPFLEIDSLKEFTDRKAEKRSHTIDGSDLHWIEKLKSYFNKYFINVHVIPDKIFREAIGVSYSDYYSFIATLRAFALYFLCLARSYKNKISDRNTEDDNDWLMSEYMEWTVCCLNYKTLGWFIAISKLDTSAFNKLLSYYIDIISDKTPEKFEQNSYCGDGFYPPFTLMDESIIYSPHGLNSSLNINNILYSINKDQREVFDNIISPQLEPTLINQLEYVFSQLEGLETKKNVNYSESEIDLIVLSKTENICLIIQVKTTIAPDSSRTVARVQTRIKEAEKQIESFESIPNSEKESIINNVFTSSLSNIKFINLIITRSSAGSRESWKINKKYPIANYSLISKLLSDKVRNKDFKIASFDKEILSTQDELIKVANCQVNYNTLVLDKYKIVFPDIVYSVKELSGYNVKTVLNFGKYEDGN